MFASIFQISEKLDRKLKDYMPLTKVLFSKMSIFSSCLSLEGNLSICFDASKKKNDLYLIYLYSKFHANWIICSLVIGL